MATIASYGDPAMALKRIGPQARRGNARAEALLGYMYEHGLGVPQSWPAAVDYYLLAAEQGDATGQYLLGLMYDKGHGVPQDFAKAREWYGKAAAQGAADAQYNLAALYNNGQGGATETAASSASSTVVKRWCEADSCSRTRLGSVMSVMEVTQPVCVPMASISGDT